MNRPTTSRRIGVPLCLSVCIAFISFVHSGSAAQISTALSARDIKFDGAVSTSRYVRSFDDTLLAITIVQPARNGIATTMALPVIMTQDRTAGYNVARMRQFAQAGYVVVSQDRRGVGASFGKQNGFVNSFDARDAKAVIEWAAGQPFSTGKVATMGCSNQGVWQYVVATLRPKGLVAMAPACSSPQFFDHGLSTNGIPIYPAELKPFDGSCQQPVNAPPDPRRPVGKPVDEDVDGSMLRAALVDRGCPPKSFLAQYWLNMPRDGWNAFANNRPGIDDTAMTRWAAIKASRIAILQLGGWYDAAVIGQLQGQRTWGGRVIMGPWVHGNQTPGNAAIPNGKVDLDALVLAWFDHYLKGVANGADQPGVRYYTVNAPAGQEWRTMARWPGIDAKKTPLFLTQDGLASRRPSANGAATTYAGRDVPWFDGKFDMLNRGWRGDMADSDAQSLVHDGAPLKRNVELTGTPTAYLWISADVPDVNLFVAVEDVAPDGRSTYVTNGQLRASWRRLSAPSWPQNLQHWHRGFSADIRPLQEGKPTRLVFDLFPTSYIFKEGHKIRVSIVTSIGKAYQAPPLAKGKLATLTLYRDNKRSSRVDLPLESEIPINR